MEGKAVILSLTPPVQMQFAARLLRPLRHVTSVEQLEFDLEVHEVSSAWCRFDCVQWSEWQLFSTRLHLYALQLTMRVLRVPAT